MIESIEFTNYKALRNTTLPLAPFTLLLGPNGSGKSSVLQALQLASRNVSMDNPWASLVNLTVKDQMAPVRVELRLRFWDKRFVSVFEWNNKNQFTISIKDNRGPVSTEDSEMINQWLRRIQVYTLTAASIAAPVPVSSAPMHPNGYGLAAVLDEIKDNEPERWEMLLAEFREWLPEYDQVQFVKPTGGQKAIALRTKRGGHQIPASELSQGTLVALALLTLAYLPNPPSVIGLEEIDRGLHPRLLRHLQDALYRLTNPESCGEKRAPIQVIATTHSPYLLDLYRDHPEEVVIAQKEGLEVTMKRLSDIDHFHDILGDSPLSEVWYSGVLGGVSVKP